MSKARHGIMGPYNYTKSVWIVVDYFLTVIETYHNQIRCKRCISIEGDEVITESEKGRQTISIMFRYGEAGSKLD